MTETLQVHGSVEQSISDDEREQFWKSHIESWSPSGLSQAEYCRRNDLNIPRFRYWKHRFRKENLPLDFVQIPSVPVKSTRLFQHTGNPSLRIIMNSEFTIEVQDDFSPVVLEKVILTLKGM
ncbi:IS66 family insertion sequence element accessory protein TnpA [Desulforapulum autotrophicum]|nr:hypothetical protein [Desulforapulum autotrophicum]